MPPNINKKNKNYRFVRIQISEKLLGSEFFFFFFSPRITNALHISCTKARHIFSTNYKPIECCLLLPCNIPEKHHTDTKNGKMCLIFNRFRRICVLVLCFNTQGRILNTSLCFQNIINLDNGKVRSF